MSQNEAPRPPFFSRIFNRRPRLEAARSKLGEDNTTMQNALNEACGMDGRRIIVIKTITYEVPVVPSGSRTKLETADFGIIAVLTPEQFDKRRDEFTPREIIVEHNKVESDPIPGITGSHVERFEKIEIRGGIFPADAIQKIGPERLIEYAVLKLSNNDRHYRRIASMVAKDYLQQLQKEPKAN